MPSWWKSRSKSKLKAKHSPVSESTPRKKHDWRDEDCPLTPKNYGEAPKEKANSFDGILGGRNSKDSAASPFSANTGEGESRSGFAFGHPLPRPFVSSPLLFRPPLDVVAATASGSASASSVSSSGSSDDAPDLGFYRFTDSMNMERGRRVLPELRRHQHVSEDGQLFLCSPGLEQQRSSEMPVSPSKEVHLHCFNPPSSSVAVTNSVYVFNCQTVNCAPSSRESPFCASPVHPALPHISPRSPTGRQDGLKSPPQPLPLPPTTPSSPSSSRAQTQWKKGKLLGRGTFGHVYLGFNSESGQMCAIKEVHVISDDSNSKESLKQLSQEINLLSQFSHPNIVQYLGSELVEDTLSVYLEYVSGGSIHKLLQEYGAFGEPVIRNYTAQILSGLAYLHGRNTVHRDIKGANILVDPNGEVKLADFGMAKHISSYASIRSFKGSPYWMAPEVIMNGNGYNLSVDIWSLGCTVLEMATCKPPWSQFEGVAAIFKIGNGKDIPDIPDHLSSEAKSFIKSCLQRDPSARPMAVQLMDHPFVRDQVTLKSAKSSMKKDACPFLFDGSYSMSPHAKNDQRESRSVSPLRDHAYGIRAHGSRTPFSHEKQSIPVGMRMNMSLPVSPCSSPRHQHTASNRSCLPSPTHPANSAGGQTYGQSNHYLYQMRPSHHFQDPFLDVSELRIRTPYGSPKG